MAGAMLPQHRSGHALQAGPGSAPPSAVLDLQVLVRSEVVVLRDRAADVVELVSRPRAEAPDVDVAADWDHDVLTEEEVLDALEQPLALLQVGRGVVLLHRLVDLRQRQTGE